MGPDISCASRAFNIASLSTQPGLDSMYSKKSPMFPKKAMVNTIDIIPNPQKSLSCSASLHSWRTSSMYNLIRVNNSCSIGLAAEIDHKVKQPGWNLIEP